MIEIILRKDMAQFEAKPLFGHSKRELATLLSIGVVAGLLGYLIIGLLALPAELALALLLAVGAGIGYIGFGRPHGLRFEEYWRMRRSDRAMPQTMLYARPVPNPDPAQSTPPDTRPKRERKADAKAAKRDWDELFRLPDEAFEAPLPTTDDTEGPL